jgi:hypothetical protein
MKQLSSYALALAVILGAATAASDGAQAFLLSGQTQTVPAVGDEEFVGPFPSWANVKTNYGAAGDGVTDDTAAIQTALNALGPNNPTLYFPAGTYRITQTLTLASQIYVNIIGQDPAITTILWAGASGGTMLYINGAAYSRFDRLTFNGQGSAAVAVDQSKADGTSNYFDTGNEYTDDVFEYAGIGLRCGNLGYGCAETSMLRDKFLNNTVGGISMGNFNALDMWVWYSLFQNNPYGVTNRSGAGNFHVFNSIFQGSTSYDVGYGNAGFYNFRDNYSIGSAQFWFGGGSNSSSPVIMQGNTILDTTNPLSVQQVDPGTLVFIDNVVRSTAGAIAPVVQAGNSGQQSGSLLSMGNTFAVASPEVAYGRSHSFGDQVVSRSAINPNSPVLPSTPPNLGRTIFEATTTAQIVSGIASAAGLCNNAVVHIRAGTYSVSSTITVPANCPMQILGDGWFSQLVATGAIGPVLRLSGPSKVVLRNLSVGGDGNADGIEIDGADQPGSRVFGEQVTIGSSLSNNLFVDALDYATVELHDFASVYTVLSGSGTANGVKVVGGASAASGTWLGAATNIFSGSSASNYISYNVSNGAHVDVQDVWYDCCSSTQDLNGILMVSLTGAYGAFTWAGSGDFLNTTPAISINNFGGTAALAGLINQNTTGTVSLTGTGGTHLTVGLTGPGSSFYDDSSSTGATNEFLLGLDWTDTQPGYPPAQLVEVNCCDMTFLTNALTQMRSTHATVPSALPQGVTDVRIYRVNVSNAVNGIHILP